MAGTMALKGTPATAAFQTSPPPSESPKAPICVFETSLRAANQSKRSRASCTSFGPSSPHLPPEAPVPRASQASAAKPNCAIAEPIGSMSACESPSPWKRITPGQPPAGAAPAGMMYAHASGVPSEAGIVSCGPAGALRCRTPGADERYGECCNRDASPTHEPHAISPYDARNGSAAVGVFDSGVGGLTVLHECLVTMPNEDFVYLGDHARLPYGPRPLEEIRRFAREIGAYLEQQDVKLILVACNARPRPRCRGCRRSSRCRSSASSRPRRTPRCRRRATGASVCSQPRRRSTQAATPNSSTRSTPASRSIPIACPRLVPLIEGEDPYGEETESAVREYAAPLQAAAVDTVILGCTHYPLIRKIFERVFGRDVTLVFSAEETAREVAETLARKGVENERGRVGDYRFLTTGDPEAFRELGRRFLQLPGDAKSSTSRATLEGGSRMSAGRTAARPDQLRAISFEPDYLENPHGSVVITQGRTKVLCTAMVEEDIPRWLRGQGAAGSPPSTRSCRRRPATASSARRRAGSSRGGRSRSSG